MKKYRLKKDTFLAKKGELFQEVNESGAVYLQRIKQDGSDLFTKIAKAPIIDFDEWFEEVREFEEWRPKKADFYKILRWGRGIPNQVVWQDSYEDNFLLSIGNAYPLDTPDDLIIKEQKLIPQAMHRLKMAAKRAWFEFNGSEGPDWSDPVQILWCIHYYHRSGEVFVSRGTPEVHTGTPPFPTEDSARAHINNNPEDMKLLFGVE